MNSSVSGSRLAQVRGATLTGLTATLIDVRATIDPAKKGFEIPGVPGDGTWTLRDRVRAAVLNSAMAWPQAGITVELSPQARFRHGCGLDLAIAVAILAAAGTVPSPVRTTPVFAAELGLDGTLRPVRGMVPVLMAAAGSGSPGAAVIAVGNQPDATAVPGVSVIACAGLRQVAAWVRGDRGEGGHPGPASFPGPSGPSGPSGPDRSADQGLSALGVAPVLRRAVEVSAAGGHHLSVTGFPGTDVPALAAGLAGVLPGLSEREAAEVSVIHSAAGRPVPTSERIIRPPLRALDQTCTVAAMAGGGTHLHPGEAALAHHGVLCLDGAPGFPDAVLRSLVQPLRDREIVIARGGCVARFPARFILVAGMRACPCGVGDGCDCTPLQRRRYRGRVSGPLGAWLAINVTAEPFRPDQTATEPSKDEDGTSAARVAEARDRMTHRLAGTPWRLNSDIPYPDAQREWSPAADGLAVIEQAVRLGVISGQGAARVTAVAWTLADLARRSRPGSDECTQALAYWTGEAR